MNPTNHLICFKPRSTNCSTRMCRSEGPEKTRLKRRSRRLGEGREAESELCKLGLGADKVRDLTVRTYLNTYYVVATGCIWYRAAT